ncbi:hypothetical protein K402DRAFT_76835 [Aulographum hederae CBS 113979]|uniref:Uncharacterized protein n=1 Tax=Aulographum hederae CBS 113979 TaxID=1176131 RepID=A0A6G1HG04_9PEZI|nr:hypothetical protein K402DRAFT_76835 [Aulographum hederae CBS 113979]
MGLVCSLAWPRPAPCSPLRPAASQRSRQVPIHSGARIHHTAESDRGRVTSRLLPRALGHLLKVNKMRDCQIPPGSF